MSRLHICNENCLVLPEIIKDLQVAQRKLVKYWKHTRLRFTLDGRLLGDIAEAVVAEKFGLQFAHDFVPAKKRTKGVDLWTPDGRTVQVKCSAIGKGPAYSTGTKDNSANYLIFGLIRFEAPCFQIIYNGPEAPIRYPHDTISGTKRLRLEDVIAENVRQTDRLRRVK